VRTSSSGYTAHTEDHNCKAVARANLKEDGGVLVDLYFMNDDEGAPDHDRAAINAQGSSPDPKPHPLEMSAQR